MEIQFKLPELGENVDSGDVVQVLVREGEAVSSNQGVLELETDKAVVELPCPHAGRITKIHVNKGDTVKVGQTLLTLEAADEAATALSAPSGAAPQPKREAAAEPEPAPGAALAATLGLGARPAQPEAPPPAQPTPAGPAARRLARELGVDLGRVTGTGQRGRITAEDVKAALAEGIPSAEAKAAPPTARAAPLLEPVIPPGEPGRDAWGPVRRERMSQIRRTIAAQMVRSAGTIPHVTNFDDADITDLETLRKSVPPGYVGADAKLTLMPFVMKAAAIALRRHPVLNASLDEENGQIVYKQYVHLGVAVDTPRGLVVPVVRDVDRMSIPEIARTLADVAQRARQAKFSIDQLRGGTFTLSNLGAVGGSYSTPIINYPEVAVLLLGRSRRMPVVREEKVQARLLLPLSLSYDHRVVDGAAAARFLNEVIDHLQAPGRLLLDG